MVPWIITEFSWFDVLTENTAKLPNWPVALDLIVESEHFAKMFWFTATLSNNPGRWKVIKRMRKNWVSIHFFLTGFKLHNSSSVVVLVSIIFQIQFSPVSNPLCFIDTESAITQHLNYSLNRQIEQLMTLLRPEVGDCASISTRPGVWIILLLGDTVHLTLSLSWLNVDRFICLGNLHP